MSYLPAQKRFVAGPETRQPLQFVGPTGPKGNPGEPGIGTTGPTGPSGTNGVSDQTSAKRALAYSVMLCSS